jgi:hypothetical protein
VGQEKNVTKRKPPAPELEKKAMKPTVQQLIADEPLLRRVAGEVLNPPDSAAGSMADIAARLRAKCWERKDRLHYEIIQYGNRHHLWEMDGSADWCWFALTGSTMQAALCLAALGKAEGA